MKRGESIIAQSEAATSLGVASERSETRSRERRNSGYKSQKKLESDEAELRRPTAVLLHLSPPCFISLKKLRNYLIASQQHITSPPWFGAPLRYGPRPYLSGFAASLTLRRSGLNFLFSPHPRLRRFAACLGLLCFRPSSRGSEFRSRALAN